MNAESKTCKEESTSSLTDTPSSKHALSPPHRLQDNSNYYAVVQTNRLEEACTGVFKVTGGAVQVLASTASYTLTNSTATNRLFNRLHVSKTGNTIRVWMNNDAGRIIINTADTSAAPLSPGQVGIFAAGVNLAWFDNWFLASAPTCNDGVQNGEEEGIDCGGGTCGACPGTEMVTDNVWDGSSAGSTVGWMRDTWGPASGSPNWHIVNDGSSDNGYLIQGPGINTGLAFQGAPGGNADNWHGASATGTDVRRSGTARRTPLY